MDMDMDMNMTEEEMDLLRRILDNELGELREEVHHTKDSEYKAHLRHKENTLRGILAKVTVQV